MPLLSNPRHERFAQHLAGAGNASAAYRLTYGTHGASAEAGASRLLRNVKVRQRVQELQGDAARAAVMTLEEHRLLLASVARGEHTGVKISDRLRAIEITPNSPATRTAGTTSLVRASCPGSSFAIRVIRGGNPEICHERPTWREKNRLRSSSTCPRFLCVGEGNLRSNLLTGTTARASKADCR